ncbi:hypothetical protein [Bradyrhizobium sp. CCBAU 53415]|uniref:hypothetical protein n=1 Tax=Bradyrhizobium sp. CCBAU 53415 TaxID=1325119 RepID=UPI002304F4FC|nr:hypothetical protein [Bradyrhizobium sp. CCBAU 53415]MDA9466555.1 hypothetical protein [Bradyrhizobium sp. CCBAU 53415]
MRYAADRPFADKEAAATKIIEIARGIEAVQDGHIFIELVNLPFLKSGVNGEEFSAGIMLAYEREMLELHESGTYVRLRSRTG